MKYWKTILSKMLAGLLVFATISSCNEDEILKETPLDFLSTANLYSTVKEMQQAVYALHAEVRVFYVGDNDTQGGVQQNAILCGKGTDFSYDGENPAGTAWLSNWSTQVVPANTTIVGWYWERAYEIVQYTNVLIESIEATQPEDQIWLGNEVQRGLLLGEAKFFRAYAYRMLVTIYGGVPLLDKPVKTARTDFTRASADAVYDLIESDLTYAAANLPNRGKEDAPGRITNAAANHLLAETYLARHKYTAAVAAATVVIDGGQGYALMQTRFGTQLGKDDALLGGGDVFYDLFRYGNQNLTDNTETIWAIQIQNDVTGGRMYDGERMWGNAYYRIGNDPAGKKAIIGDQPTVSADYLSTFSRPVSWNRPTNYVAYTIWASDWSNDIRNARHNIFRDWRYNNPASPAWYGKPINLKADYPAGKRNLLSDTSQVLFPFPTKCASPGLHFTDPARQGGGANHVDRYAIRLAETYLLRAEAYLGAGNVQAAADDINVVRGRAKASPIDVQDVDIDYILDERARELYTEEFRLLTLMRLGLLYDRTVRYHNNPVAAGGVGAGIQPRNNKFPIPQNEIDLNIGAVLDQNDLY
jgi:hypothetical protein